MIASLAGILRTREPSRVVVETGGVGYEVFIPLTTYYRLPPVGSPVFLEIRQVVREDALTLYGFTAPAERRAFDLLTQVQHVGPRHALSILSALSPEELAAAISREDVHRIDAVPGVGTKLAERVVRELRDKLGDLRVSTPAQGRSAEGGGQMQDGAGTVGDDAVSALVNLAYKPAQARRAVDSVMTEDSSADLETVIRKALAVLLSEK